MMFYNGFNLLIDIILAAVVWKLARSSSDRMYVSDANYFWQAGQYETLDAIDQGLIYKDMCDGEMVWTFKEDYING